MERGKPCWSGEKYSFSDEQVSVRRQRLALYGSSKFSQHSIEKLERRADDEQYWLELDDIHELIRKLDAEDAG